MQRPWGGMKHGNPEGRRTAGRKWGRVGPVRGPERGLCIASLDGGAAEGLRVDQLTGEHFTLSRAFGFFCPTNFFMVYFLSLSDLNFLFWGNFQAGSPESASRWQGEKEMFASWGLSWMAES